MQSDKNAERIKFSCPKIVGDNLDLSKFSVRINFENVSSVDSNVSIKDQYICDDVAVDGENVTFSWLIGRNAARYMGTVRFIVCAVKTDSDSNISVEWNTAIAEVPVLEGIEIGQPQIGQEEKDVINQLLELTKSTSAEAVQNVNSAKEQAIKDIQSVSQPDTTLTIEGGLAEAKATGEAIGSLKEDLSFWADKHISASMTNFVADGRQLFNKDAELLNGYYNNGKFVERSDMAGHFIKIKGGSNICANGTFFYGATFDKNRKLIKEYLNVEDNTYITTDQNAEWLYVATSTQVLDRLVVTYGDSEGKTIGNSWDKNFAVDGKYIDGVTAHTVYKLPYIQNCKVRCNGGNDTVTAYYAGVDCKKKVNIIQCRWIWEIGTNTGTLALIINPNGVRYIKDITASSLHLQVRNNQIKLDVLGVKYGNYYYQNIIDKTLDTVMPLDNKTEHIVSLVANGNECIVTLDGTEYTGTFIPDDKITALSEILGPYATFEHFCYGKRESYAMPQITQFIVRAGDEYIVDDDFQRQDGQLQNTPQGIPYCLISTLSNRG